MFLDGHLPFPARTRHFAGGAWHDIEEWDGVTWFFGWPSKLPDKFVPVVGPGSMAPIGFTLEQICDIFWRWRRVKTIVSTPFVATVPGFTTPATGKYVFNEDLHEYVWTVTPSDSVVTSEVVREESTDLSNQVLGNLLDIEEPTEWTDEHHPNLNVAGGFYGRTTMGRIEGSEGNSWAGIVQNSGHVEDSINASASTDVTYDFSAATLMRMYFGLNAFYRHGDLYYPTIDLEVRTNIRCANSATWQEAGPPHLPQIVESAGHLTQHRRRYGVNEGGVQNFGTGPHPVYSYDKPLLVTCRGTLPSGAAWEKTVEIPCQETLTVSESGGSATSTPSITYEGDWRVIWEPDKYFTYGGIYDETTGVRI